MFEMPDDSFFIGWSGRLPTSLVRFYICVGLTIIIIFGVMGIFLGLNINDPGRNLFVSRTNKEVARPESLVSDHIISGSLTLMPYPILHQNTGKVGSFDRSVLLSGSGKQGVFVEETMHRVKVLGGLLKRGDIEMLVVDDLSIDIENDKSLPALAPTSEPLGQWKSVGEICDGKCYPGGMTPGYGLAHRACATLCLIGDVPAIFVVAEPIESHSFLLIAGPDGGPPGPWIKELIARPVELVGAVERLGSILIIKVDPEKARIL